MATNNDVLTQVEQAKETYFLGDLDGALKLFLPLAKTGHGESQYYLGLIYNAEGWSKRDTVLAISYLLSATDQNHAAVMWLLGQMHETGAGIDKDLMIATDWYRKSEDTDRSLTSIQFMKIEKDSIALQSTTDVVESLHKLAMEGDVESQYKLAKTYDSGTLITRDLTKALDWYETAARNGHTHSMFLTGYFYCRGLGVVQDEKKANIWLERSGRKATCR